MAIINGTNSNDILDGSSTPYEPDIIYGLDGDDTITGNGSYQDYDNTGDDPIDFIEGDDVVYGGEGNDKISGGTYSAHGGAGNDRITGGTRNENREDADKKVEGCSLSGDDGDDIIEATVGFLDGGNGNDRILISGSEAIDSKATSVAYGGEGDDFITAEGNSRDYWSMERGLVNIFDILYGGNGNDTIKSFTTAHIFGGDGNDIIIDYFGNIGNFIANLHGDEGNDTISGNGNLFGDAGNDILNGGDGADVLRGGLDTDTFVFDNLNGVDTIGDFESNEKIDVKALLQGVVGFIPSQAFALGFLRLEQNGDDTNLFINKGDGEKHLAILLDYQADQIGIENFILPNTPPTAKDDSFTVAKDSKVMGNVLSDNGYGADADANGDPLTIVSGTYATANGNITIAKYGTFTYTPNAGFHGVDTFEYTVQDGQGGTDIGLVTFSVTPPPAPAPLIISGTVGNDTLFGGYGNDTIKGREGDDVLLGGTGWDRLEGNEGNDILYGGKGSDWMKGGAGADLFVLDGVTTRVDTIDDLRISKGDALQIRDILHYDPLHDAITDFVHIVQDGANSVLSVDADGLLNGVNFVASAIITGVTGLDVNQLYADGDLIIGHVVV